MFKLNLNDTEIYSNQSRGFQLTLSQNLLHVVGKGIWKNKKLESSSRSWKTARGTSYCIENFPTVIDSFQLKWELSIL